MSDQKHIHLNVNYPILPPQPGSETASPAEDYQINIQVANGWAITGYYHDHTLQAITLKKSTMEVN
jgi:hypothetical protein